MKEYELEAIKDIVENSDMAERKAGDFLIKNDFGSNAYYIGKGGTVVIPEEIDEKTPLHFGKENGITALHFPGTRKTISDYEVGSGKLGCCDTLERLDLSEGVQRISGTGCFADCPNLKTVRLPESLEYMGLSAFKNSIWFAENLTVVEGCHYLGDFLISSDKDIVHANIREGTKMVCAWAFRSRKNLIDVTIPESVKVIGSQAFTGCELLERVVIPGNTLELIESSVFTGCTGLKQIEIPDSCKHISSIAFVSNTAKILYMPECAYIPNIKLDDCNAIQKLFYGACYLTSKERHSHEEQAKYDIAVKKMKSKLLDFVIAQRNIAAFKNIAPIAITKKNAGAILEKVQAEGAVELTAFLLEYSK